MTKPVSKLAAAAVVFVLTASPLVGQTPAPRSAPSSIPAAPIDVHRLGPQVGDHVPGFLLQDQAGKTWTLQSIMGPKGAVLVFFRSADWCPYCKTQLAELQARVVELHRQGYGLAAISDDPPAILANFTERRGITYPLLSDPGSRTIKAYGILNTTIPPTGQTYGIPFPGTFMLDRHGVVTARYFENAYQQRNTVSSVLLKAGGSVGIAGTRVSNGQIDLTAYTSDDVVAPGTTFALVVDIAPKARVHVYAPGAVDYRVIALKVDARPPIKIAPAQFPPSEIFYFAPLKERVPVYQKPFRLVQDVWLDPSAEAAPLLRGMSAVTIDATLDYQACDDKVCYPPTSLPLSWTVKVRTLDTERPTTATRDR